MTFEIRDAATGEVLTVIGDMTSGDGERYDVSPLGEGKNWVTSVGGLPLFIRAVAHALIRNGHSESQAIQIAVGVMKNWASGRGDVSAKTRAKAAKALAEWEAKKAAAHATPNKRSSTGHAAVDQALAGLRGDKPGHPFHGNQWIHDLADALAHGEAFDGHAADRVSGPMHAVKATGHARILGSGSHEQALAADIRDRLSREGVTAGVHKVSVNGHEFTRVFDTARHASTAADKRDGLTEADTAGALLPVAPLPTGPRRHAFKPKSDDPEHCKVCGAGPDAMAHTMKGQRGLTAVSAALQAAGFRHGGVGHHGVSTGHLTRKRRETLTAIHRQADNLEPAVQRTMAGLFAQQKRATLDRLNGRRGQQMIRAATPPDDPEASEERAPLVDAGQVYDLAFWAGKIRDALDPVLGAVVSMTADRFAAQLGEHESQSSLGAVGQVLDERLARLARLISQTTFDDVARVLRRGVIQGQTLAQMTTELEALFDEARANRAPTIARTETLGALNQAAAVYADNLPADVVAGREWLAAHDSRVRPTHREADGQIRAMGMPFDVGGFPMTFPHDPAAPPGETINCRCSVAYLTPAEYAKRTRPASVAA